MRRVQLLVALGARPECALALALAPLRFGCFAFSKVRASIDLDVVAA